MFGYLMKPLYFYTSIPHLFVTYLFGFVPVPWRGMQLNMLRSDGRYNSSACLTTICVCVFFIFAVLFDSLCSSFFIRWGAQWLAACCTTVFCCCNFHSGRDVSVCSIRSAANLTSTNLWEEYVYIFFLFVRVPQLSHFAWFFSLAHFFRISATAFLSFISVWVRVFV